jgi:hypothetical protein
MRLSTARVARADRIRPRIGLRCHVEDEFGMTDGRPFDVNDDRCAGLAPAGRLPAW